MSNHLADHDLTRAAAGLELAAADRDHLASCLACHAALTAFAGAVASRRAALEREAMSRPALSAAVMARLAAQPAPRPRRHPPLLQGVLAMAATLVMAVGLGLVVRRHAVPELVAVPTPVAALAVEDVLAEMEAILADDSIPGLWVADPVGDVDDLASLLANPAS